MKKNFIMLIMLIMVVNVAYSQRIGKLIGKIKAKTQAVAEPSIYYDSINMGNNNWIVYPGRIRLNGEMLSTNVFNNDTITLRYVLSNKSLIEIKHLGRGVDHQRARITYPDGSYYEGEYDFLYAETNPDLVNDSLKYIDGILYYKNGDKLEINRNDVYRIVHLNNITPQTFILGNYEFTLPRKITRVSNSRVVDILNNQSNENNTNPAVEYATFIKSNIIDPSFWESGNYPSVIATKRMESITNDVKKKQDETLEIKEQLKSAAISQYSGAYRVDGLGNCKADYTYKTINNIRYKDGKIHCYTEPINIDDRSAPQLIRKHKRVQDLYGLYDNGERTGKWEVKSFESKSLYRNISSVKNSDHDYSRYSVSGNYKCNRRDGDWVLYSNSKTDKWEYNTNHMIKSDSIYSKTSFKNGVFIGDFILIRIESYNNKTTSEKTTGRFTENGVMDGDWVVEKITTTDNEKSNHSIETIKYTNAAIVSYKIELPMTGALFEITTNGISKANTSVNVSREEYEGYKFALFDIVQGIDLQPIAREMPMSNNYPSGLSQIHSAINIWLTQFAYMEVPQDNEYLVKFYGKYY